MNIDLNKHELQQIRKALETRLDDLQGFAYKAGVVGKNEVKRKFTEVAGDCEKLLEKIKKAEVDL